MPPRPFQIDVPDDVLDDLRERLARTRWPEPLEGADWDYGAKVSYIRELCAYWRTDYDWRRHEAAINQWPGYLCEVDGVDLHYLVAHGRGPNPSPLMLIHGWPGSIVEFLELLGPLSDPAAYGGDPADAFDLVVPALPGFGFGGKPRDRGWGITRIGAAFDRLMAEELGYTRYGVQGGDWGGIISSKMASAHADHVVAAHLNFAIGQPPAEMSEDDKAALARRDTFQAQETGYSNVQGTKPDSLTVGQSDSPAGLAAWVVEKFRTWGDCGGDVESAFSKDTLLTNLMFYWAPNSVASSARIYYEARRDPEAFRYPRVEVPMGIAAFPGEPWNSPRQWLDARYNVVHYAEMPSGGHFAALEQPQLLIDDIRAFFRTVR